MKWVEIIKIRTVGVPESLLVSEIFEDFSSRGKGMSPSVMKLYHHATVESDHSIHIYWESETISPRKSPVGLRIFESIGALGVANHSIWVEDMAASVV